MDRWKGRSNRIGGRCRLGLAFAYALVLFAPVPVLADDAASASLEGAAAWKAIVGNTVVATSQNGAYSEFFEPGGAIRHVDEAGRATGQWTLDGDKVCFDYPEEDDRSCVSVTVNGTTGVFIDQDGAKDAFAILPGNAKNL